MSRITDTVKHLIIINVIFFIATQFMGDVMYENLSLFYPKNEHFGFWQFVSSMFMHGGVMHILFNMYALWAFGSPLEKMWGRNKFLFFYFAAGIGAGIVYSLVNYSQFNSIFESILATGISPEDIQNILETGKYNTVIEQTISKAKISEFYSIYHTPAVGASGAIYGVLVAFAFKFPDVELMLMFIPFPIKAKFFIPAIVALDLFSGLTGFSIFGSFGSGGVAHFAHVGGALIGYLLMLYFQKSQFKRWN
ncbi:MAG TPA: rhomboid family intramembrane serine protease [Lutibacter sp.]|nr:rhomboid family intramembrane serine protease [Lutibacter sp.]